MNFSIATKKETTYMPASKRYGKNEAGFRPNLAVDDNRPAAVIQRKQLVVMQNHTPKKVSDYNTSIIQLAKWEWDDTNEQWIMLKGHSGEEAPEFPGEYDGEIFDDTPRKSKEKDEAFNGKRTFGDSLKLAKNRYARGPKPVDFKTWKKPRHAQHLIPASSAKKRKSLQGIIDDPENGMMLPAKLASKNRKVTHLKPKHRDHPVYTKQVNKLIEDVIQNTSLKDNQGTMQMIMNAVRPVNRLYPKYNYLDDIPYAEFKASWNSMYSGYPI